MRGIVSSLFFLAAVLDFGTLALGEAPGFPGPSNPACSVFPFQRYSISEKPSTLNLIKTYVWYMPLVLTAFPLLAGVMVFGVCVVCVWGHF